MTYLVTAQHNPSTVQHNPVTAQPHPVNTQQCLNMAEKCPVNYANV